MFGKNICRANLFIYLFVYLFINLFIYLLIYLFIYLFFSQIVNLNKKSYKQKKYTIMLQYWTLSGRK